MTMTYSSPTSSLSTASWIPPPHGLQALAVVGGILVTRSAFRLARYTRRHFLPEMPTLRRPMDFLESRYGSGSWVLVAGANTTMGCALAHQFAQRNFSLILMDGDLQKLEQLVRTFQKEYPLILIKTIEVNFELAAMKGWTEDILQKLDKLSISVLINAAAAIDTMDDRDHSPTSRGDIETIRISLLRQLFPSTLLTKALLPHLEKRYKKLQLHGAIITVTAKTPMPSNKDKNSVPWLSYSLSRSITSFTCIFSKMVHVDASGSVDFLTIHPGTNVSCDARGLFAITPQDCAGTSIEQLRYGVPETSGWWFHELQQWLLQSMPLKGLHQIWIWRSNGTYPANQKDQ